MSLAFAAAEARIGRAIGARLANAWLVVGVEDPIAGIFTRSASGAGLGTVGMRARDISLDCDTAALDALSTPLAAGSAVTVFYGDQLVTPAGAYLVRGEPTASHETGRTRLDLELAP